MAKKKEKNKISSSIVNTLNSMQELLNNIYNSTYSSSKMNDNDIENITNDLSKSIDNIIANSYGDDGTVNNMSKIIDRLDNNSNANLNTLLKDVLDKFDNGEISTSILDVYNTNQWIREFDYEVDTILKYMPRLHEALECLKDCVLSADHFSKEYLTLKTHLADGVLDTFTKRSSDLKKKYNLSEFFEDCYDDMSKYGEAFVYISPYNKEIAKLLNNKSKYNIGNNKQMFQENAILENVQDQNIERIINDVYKDQPIPNINIQYSYGFIESAYDNMNNINSIIESNNHSIYNKIINEGKSIKIDDDLIPNDLVVPNDVESFYNKRSSDGMVELKEVSPNQLKAPGCVLKKLDRSNVLLLLIEKLILGYYYIEIVQKNNVNHSNINNISSIGLTKDNYADRLQNSDNIDNDKLDNIISYISAKISQSIDKNFVNSNQDITNDIYLILKHNDIFNNANKLSNCDIKVTYIPADDLVHMYFKKDPKTGRGISDLVYSIFPAKLYISLYVNNVINNLTRGQDKRVYYVKQNVETNISATLMNVLNQIKKGNFGFRQVNGGIQSLMNIVGKFNDYIIPVNNSNDPPIQFEIMPGMKTDIDQELMDRLEKMAINPTDVPLEMIETRQSLDFAIQATMVNSKLARKSYRRQDKMQKFGSIIISKIFNYEYGENVDITMQLPAPAFLNMNNTNNLLSSTESYLDALNNILNYDEDDNTKAEFKKLGLEYYISGQLDINVLESLKKRAKLIASSKVLDENK